MHTNRKRQTFGLCRVRTRGGFTLLEMMSAIIILIVGVLGVFTLLITAMQSDMESAHYAMARTFAQEELESIRTLRFTEISGATIPNCVSTVSVLAAGTTRTTANATTLTPPTALPGATAKLWVITQSSSTNASLDWAVVQVTWTEPGRGAVGNTSLLIDTYIADSGISTHT